MKVEVIGKITNIETLVIQSMSFHVYGRCMVMVVGENSKEPLRFAFVTVVCARQRCIGMKHMVSANLSSV